jgi:hypothetical protein
MSNNVFFKAEKSSDIRKEEAMRTDLGYPWGIVEIPDGYRLTEVEAACDAEDHFSHPFCSPGWEEDLPEGAIVVAGPVLDSFSGWIALVAIPPGAPLVGRLVQEEAE